MGYFLLMEILKIHIQTFFPLCIFLVKRNFQESKEKCKQDN